MLKTLTTDIFFKRYAIYFTGSMVVAFLNYIFHPVLGRLLSPEEFGDVQAFIALIAQSAVILGAFSLVAVHITTNTEDANERNAIFYILQKIAFGIVGIVFFLILISATTLNDFFNFSSPLPLLGLAVILPITAVSTFRNAYLQGSGFFGRLSIAGIISSSSRLIFAVILVLMGFGVLGATLGIVLSNVALLMYLLYQTRGVFHIEKSSMQIHEKGSVRKEILYGVLVFFGTGLITLLYTADVLIVKHYFSATEAGLYSGISAIAKIIYFAIGPSSAVLLASVKMKQTMEENAKELKKALGISTVVGLGGIFTFYVFHDIIIKVMLGNTYVSFAYFLPKVGLVMLLVAIANVFVYYFLALRRFFLIGVSIVGTATLGIILFQGHATIERVLNNLLLAIGCILGFLIFIYAKDHFNRSTRL